MKIFTHLFAIKLGNIAETAWVAICIEGYSQVDRKAIVCGYLCVVTKEKRRQELNGIILMRKLRLGDTFRRWLKIS